MCEHHFGITFSNSVAVKEGSAGAVAIRFNQRNIILAEPHPSSS
jgi:hypothetical protein